MTVKELIDVSPYCDMVEIVIREHGHGKWVQGYRIGKNAKLYPVNLSVKLREKYNLEKYQSRTIPLDEGDEVDCENGRGCPMKVICKDVSKIPDYIGNLKVCDVQPRNIPIIHKDALTHNNFSWDIDCFPDGYVPEPEKKKDDTDKVDGQLTIDQWVINSVTY